MNSRINSLKKLKSASPSISYDILNKCAYELVLKRTYDRDLIPKSAAAYLGTVIHKIIDLNSKGHINNVEQFNSSWDQEINEVEDKLKNMGFYSIVPLKKNTKGFGTKKEKCKRSVLVKKVKPIKRDIVSSYGNEKELKSNDGLIIGTADRIIQSNNGAIIFDMKTGDILDDGDVKEIYRYQLLLYAYLWFEEQGEYPHRLVLSNLSDVEYDVEFSEGEISELVKNIKEKLESVNKAIDEDQIDSLASPSLENCSYCVQKARCEYHWGLDELKEHDFTNLRGDFVRRIESRNGNISIEIDENGTSNKIKGLSIGQVPELNHNQHVSVYNIRKDQRRENSFKAISRTVIIT